MESPWAKRPTEHTAAPRRMQAPFCVVARECTPTFIFYLLLISLFLNLSVKNNRGSVLFKSEWIGSSLKIELKLSF
jgi:hypothetical protein